MTEAPQLELCIINPTSGYRCEGITLTKAGLTVREDMTYEEWREGLGGLKWMSDHIKLAKADYIAWGKIKFGDELVNTALIQLEFSLPEMKQVLNINAVPMELRHDNLNADHYIVLGQAKLNKRETKRWADLASVQQLSPADLKKSIVAGEVRTGATPRDTQGIITVNGIRVEFEAWLAKVKGVEGILAMEKAAITDILKELQPMATLYQQIIKGISSPKKATKKPAKKKARK